MGILVLGALVLIVLVIVVVVVLVIASGTNKDTKKEDNSIFGSSKK